MSENKKFFKSSQSLCFVFLGSVFLTSCTNHFGPFYIPSGYSHHHEEYKAPDGSELVTIPEKAPEEISEEEHQILLELIRLREERGVERMRCLIELAQVRKLPLQDLMKELEIHSLSDAA